MIAIDYRRLTNYINLAQKAGLVVWGIESVAKVLRSSPPALIIFRPDLGKSAGRDLEMMRERYPAMRIFRAASVEVMNEISGKMNVKVMAIKVSPLAEEIGGLIPGSWSANGKKV